MKTAVDKLKGRIVNARFFVVRITRSRPNETEFCNVASGWDNKRVAVAA